MAYKHTGQTLTGKNPMLNIVLLKVC